MCRFEIVDLNRFEGNITYGMETIKLNIQSEKVNVIKSGKPR